MIGVHRWVRNRNPEDGDTAATARGYRECERCHKERTKKTKSRSDIGGIGGWDGGEWCSPPPRSTADWRDGSGGLAALAALLLVPSGRALTPASA